MANHTLNSRLNSRPKKIFLVDDDPHVAGALGEILRAWGHFVVVSATLDSARSILHSTPQPFDIVLADYSLEGHAGADFLASLDTGGTTPKLVLMSGTPLSDLELPPEAAERIEFLQKPFSPDQLRPLLQDHQS